MNDQNLRVTKLFIVIILYEELVVLNVVPYLFDEITWLRSEVRGTIYWIIFVAEFYFMWLFWMFWLLIDVLMFVLLLWNFRVLYSFFLLCFIFYSVRLRDDWKLFIDRGFIVDSMWDLVLLCFAWKLFRGFKILLVFSRDSTSYSATPDRVSSCFFHGSSLNFPRISLMMDRANF